MTDETPPLWRARPRQDRSRASVEAILEAAAQVLEASGEAGFNTNAVARRAGVSIGALYRYFPDKRAILVALARRERDSVDAQVTAALTNPPAGLSPDRAAIRAFLGAFGGRRRARKAALLALLADDPVSADGFAAMPSPVNADGQALTPIQAFVLYRSVHGVMRAAVMEDQPFLLDPAFEDELVRLGRAYLGFSGPVVGRQSDGDAPSDAL
ncbi:MAG: TetR/AcrR family transcriptional regulator [Caulobacter sp.]|nr:TetR/AcrR family transcriptional regulator [Caulobacter sp.]